MKGVVSSQSSSASTNSLVDSFFCDLVEVAETFLLFIDAPHVFSSGFFETPEDLEEVDEVLDRVLLRAADRSKLSMVTTASIFMFLLFLFWFHEMPLIV